MLGLEALDEPIDRCRFDRGREIHGNAPVLSPVANIRRSKPCARLGPGTHPALEMLAHLGVQPTKSREIWIASIDAAEPDVVELRPREEQAGRRKETGEWRDDGGLDTEFRGERGRVNGP